MLVDRITEWCETATTESRLEMARRFAAMFAGRELTGAERAHAAAIVSFFAGDPSPRVRLAVAEALAGDSGAPVALMRRFCDDIDPIASAVAARSPVLRESHLLDIIASGRAAILQGVATRGDLTPRLVVSLSSLGSIEVAYALLSNRAAPFARRTFDILIERFGEAPGLLEVLVKRDDLPLDLRELLVERVAERLRDATFITAVLGKRRAEKVAFDASETARAQLADVAHGYEIPLYVSHLRSAGRLTSAFLLRQAIAGNIDLFVIALAQISGTAPERVRAIVADGREGPFRRLAKACGIATEAVPVLVRTTGIWRRVVSQGLRAPTIGEVAAMIMDDLTGNASDCDNGAFDETLTYLSHLAGEDARRELRDLLLVA